MRLLGARPVQTVHRNWKNGYWLEMEDQQDNGLHTTFPTDKN